MFEDGAFAWVNLTPDASMPVSAAEGPGLSLRSIFTTAAVATVRRQLLQGYAQHPVNVVDEFTLDGARASPLGIRFMLQPVTEAQTIVHARLRGAIDAAQRLSLLRTHNALMTAVRDRAEARASC